MVKTNYGMKKERKSKFVIVAPHAAGDDINTGPLSKKISGLCNSYLIVNEDYKRTVEDFNRLSWSASQGKYLWGNKNPDMKRFYDDVEEFAERAKRYGNGKSVIIFVHGMADNPEQIGMSLGFGAKFDRDEKLKGTQGRRNKHPEAGKNTGVIRADRADMLKLKNRLENKLEDDCSLGVWIGGNDSYTAWSRQNGIQIFAGKKDITSFQIEISKELRKRENLDYTAKVISDGLKSVYR